MAKFCIYEQHGGICTLSDHPCNAGPCEILEELSPIQLGHWEYNTDFYIWVCSECGENPHKGTGVVVVEENLPAYCPHCGARMEGAENE